MDVRSDEEGRTARRALYRMARVLRYRALPDLVGQQIRVTATASVTEVVEGLVRGLAGARATTGARLRQPVAGFAELAMLKYGLIDAELEADPVLLEHPETLVGLEVMRECGVLPRRGTVWDREEREFGVAYALELEAAMIESGCALKLMLTDDCAQQTRWEAPGSEVLGRGTAETARALARYLPRTFEVKDACVTNSSTVWFARYFYL
jgi:hypothetical protein